MAIKVVKTKPSGSIMFDSLAVGDWFEWDYDSDMMFLKISEGAVENCLGFDNGYTTGEFYTAGKNDLVTYREDITIFVGEE